MGLVTEAPVAVSTEIIVGFNSALDLFASRRRPAAVLAFPVLSRLISFDVLAAAPFPLSVVAGVYPSAAGLWLLAGILPLSEVLLAKPFATPKTRARFIGRREFHAFYFRKKAKVERMIASDTSWQMNHLTQARGDRKKSTTVQKKLP